MKIKSQDLSPGDRLATGEMIVGITYPKPWAWKLLRVVLHTGYVLVIPEGALVEVATEEAPRRP